MSVFINEFHYDNAGTDTGEFIEIAGLAGTNLADWQIVLYNGSNGSVYNTQSLPGIIPDQDNGFGTVTFTYPSNGIQNGGPDGIALVDNTGAVIQFLSYEGSFTAVGGPADGLVSTDVGVSETSTTPVGFSLQLTGTGTQAEDFTWAAAATNTAGAINTDQSFGTVSGGNVFISEIHYDNASTDTGEFIEVTGDAGVDLSGYSLALYNGNNGAVYNTVALSGTFSDEGEGLGAIAFDIPGIQNGAPDGVALVDPNDNVIEFISYEGSFTAVGGPADGLTSTDIGVAETSSTPVGQSLQLIDGVWTGPAAETRGAVNTGDGGGNGGGNGEVTTIYEVQGRGDTSGKVGETVIVEGIVTGDFQDGDADTSRNLRGFYIQDETGDNNVATSDGIFVFDPSLLLDVNPGDKVRVTGTVAEFFGETQISASAIESIGTGSVAAVNIDLPAVDVMTNSDGELIADLEQYEGMLVSFNDPLTVDEYFNYDRFGEIRLSEGERPFQFTQTNAPDVAGFQAHLEDLARRTITLDDGQSIQNPDPLAFPAPGFSDSNNFRGGDTVTGVTGNVRFSRGSGGSGDETYRIMPTMDPTFTSQNPRPNTPEDVGGRLKVSSFNVLNYFTTLDEAGNGSGPNNLDPRGADNPAEFDRQQEKLVTAITTLDADILGLVELENTDIVNGEDVSVGNLVDAVNARLGNEVYDYISTGFIGGDAIKVGLIYKSATVQPSGDFAILDSSVDPTFIDNRNRPALAQTFEEVGTGEKVTVAVNHFKSKGSSGLSDASDPNFDQGDGQGFWNAVRTDAANALTNWLATDPTDSGDSDVLILGDLNAYANEDPIAAIEAAGYTDLGEQFSSGVPYSFLFDGQIGTLDYGLANSSLLSQVTGATEWHVNADEADALDYNLDFGRNPDLFNGSNPFRNSDHDPLIIGLDLSSNSQSKNTFWFSPDRDGLVGNAEDIVLFDGSGYSTVFDGSELGLSRSKIDAFDILDDTMILMSFDRPVTLAGLGRIDDSDVVKFKVASLGEGSTAGSFELFLDGSELGLTRGGEDIDALTGLSDGSIAFSTQGNARLSNGLRVKSQDLIRYDPLSGETSLYFDGSDVDLTRRSEDIKGVGVMNDQLLFSTIGRFVVEGVNGQNEDVFSFTPASIGENTSGTFDGDLFFDGSQFGFTGNLAAVDFSIA